MITYHFARPQPESDELFLQFTEVYANEMAFWMHTARQDMQQAYIDGFTEQNKKRADTYCYGPVGDQVRGVLDIMFKCQYPKFVGTLLNAQVDLSQQSNDAVMLRMRAPSTSTVPFEAVVQNLSQHISTAIVEQLTENVVEVVLIAVNHDALVKHLQANKSVLATMECDVYGKASDDTKSFLQSAFTKVQYRGTESGYVIHPQAALQ